MTETTLWAAELALRLRECERSFRDDTSDQRAVVLRSRIDDGLVALPADQREAYLEALARLFPEWLGSDDQAPQAPPSPDELVDALIATLSGLRPEQARGLAKRLEAAKLISPPPPPPPPPAPTLDELVARLRELASGLPGADRENLAGELAEAGLVPAPVETPRELSLDDLMTAVRESVSRYDEKRRAYVAEQLRETAARLAPAKAAVPRPAELVETLAGLARGLKAKELEELAQRLAQAGFRPPAAQEPRKPDAGPVPADALVQLVLNRLKVYACVTDKQARSHWRRLGGNERTFQVDMPLEAAVERCLVHRQADGQDRLDRALKEAMLLLTMLTECLDTEATHKPLSQLAEDLKPQTIEAGVGAGVFGIDRKKVWERYEALYEARLEDQDGLKQELKRSTVEWVEKSQKERRSKVGRLFEAELGTLQSK
jgi:hypothetical protein